MTISYVQKEYGGCIPQAGDLYGECVRRVSSVALVFLFSYHQETVIIQRQVTIVVAIVIGLTGLGRINMCQVFELKAQPLQLVFIGLCRLFPLRQYGLQHLPVLQ